MSSRLRQLTADYDSVCALLKKVRSGEAPEEKQYRHYISDSRRRKANAVSEETIRSAAAVAMTDDTTLETIYEEDLEELFTKNPPKAEMILQHLGIRIRQLSNDYIDACNELADAAQ